MSCKSAKIIRTVTVAPVMAGILLTILYFNYDNFFLSMKNFLFSLFFLTVLPLLSYPVCFAIPKLRKSGRKAQRNTAIIFAVAGYIAGTLYCFLLPHTYTEAVLYLTYLLSGIIIAVLTIIKVKGSGHACGVAGPITLLSYFMGPIYMLGCLLLGLVFHSSLKLKRHTALQLIVGSAVPVAAFFLSLANFI